jgi:predicted nucleic acid-binding protein
VITLGLTPEVCERAAELEPMILRSLDALHLACALQLAEELEGVVTYDELLGQACALLGVPVVAPVSPPGRRSRRGM